VTVEYNIIRTNGNEEEEEDGGSVEYDGTH